MPTNLCDDLDRALSSSGPDAAIDLLIESLRSKKDYPALFYALLVKSRRELGVSPIPNRPAEEIPDSKLDAYEEAIRAAGREIGQRFLDAGDIPSAWHYFRLIGDLSPVRAAIEAYRPDEGDGVYPIIEIALQHGVHPVKGFDLLLERQGICNAVTFLSSMSDTLPEAAKLPCLGRLVRALHSQLLERLQADVAEREGKAPGTIPELVAGRDWLFAEDCYHIDLSHLHSVVNMALHLPPGPELSLAHDLCAYGEKLSPKMQFNSDEPFENFYRDAGIYLRTIGQQEVEAGLEHFRAKAQGQGETRPAEVYVNLLLKLGREKEALQAARELLPEADERELTCPGVMELSRRLSDFESYAEAARKRGDPVHFLAGRLARLPQSK